MRKGEYGYIKRGRRRALLISALFLAAVFLLYGIPRAVLGTNRNVFSILAALLCLPAGRWIVKTVLFMKASGCSEDAHQRILKDDPDGIYDLYLTSYNKNFDIAHLTAGAGRIAALTEDPGLDEEAAAAHLNAMLGSGGFSRMKITFFSDPEKYLAAAKAVREEGEEPQGLKDLLFSISI